MELLTTIQKIDNRLKLIESFFEFEEENVYSLSREEAKSAIIQLLKSSKEKFYRYEIADKLGLDLRLVNEIIVELKEEGVVK